MAESNGHRFRTAMGGFHKGDVSAYITKTAAQHRKQIAALEEQLEAEQAENEELRAQLEALQAEAAPPEPPAPETAGTAEETPLPDGITRRELDAYRRAEAAERLSYQRAGKLYADMQRIYERSGGQLETVSQAAKDAMEALDGAMDTLMSTLEKTRLEAQVSAEELEAMGALVPDPAEGLEDTE